MMRLKIFVPLFWVLLMASCSTSGPGLFKKQSLHEQYGNKIIQAGLQETALGRQWFAAAEQALARPVAISLPYKEVGYFAADKPRAVGLEFSARRGEKLLFTVEKRPIDSFIVYADIWKRNASGSPSFVASLDTAKKSFDLEVEDNSSYIIRLQPELLRSGEYSLSIAIGPSLGFPVAGKAGRVGSFWGADRDAGARRHEGIDIFAPRRTPAVAAADGTVTRANENNLGGKVVWFRPKGKDYTLYYAHLDSQLATAGQRLKKGDTLGLVGNTGNARATPPHLHFGIYAIGGAIDPLPFVNPDIKEPGEVPFVTEGWSEPYRLERTTDAKTGSAVKPLKAHTLVYPVAKTARTYRVLLPDDTLAEIPSAAAGTAGRPLRQSKLSDSTAVYDTPHLAAPRKAKLEPSVAVAVLAYFNDFAFIRTGNEAGWVPITALR